jgi:hypothetical protein
MVDGEILEYDPPYRFAHTQTAKEMLRGGMFILNNLKSIVETGRPPLLTRLMYKAMGAFESLLPRRTRSDRWPLETFGKEKR